MRNNEVLLLTMHKQHYTDVYPKSMFKSKISCLGYYDEITILEAPEVTECRLSKRKSNEPMSTIWYQIGEQVKGIKGGYSNQNIGLFRAARYENNEDYLKSYWLEEENLAYFGVGFIKMAKADDYDKLSERIEKKINNEKLVHEKRKVVFYCTFENLLIKIKCFSQKISSKKEYNK